MPIGTRLCSICVCLFFLIIINCLIFRYKNAQKKRPLFPSSSVSSSERVLESGSVINVKSELLKTDDDDDEDVVVVVDDVVEPVVESVKTELEAVDTKVIVTSASLSVEEALEKLPPIDHNALLEVDEVSVCSCQLRLVSNPTHLICRYCNHYSF